MFVVFADKYLLQKCIPTYYFNFVCMLFCENFSYSHFAKFYIKINLYPQNIPAIWYY